MSAGGASVDAYAGKVHFRVLGCGGLHPLNAVREAGVLEIFIGDLLEFLSAVVGSKTIDLDDDESGFGHFVFMAGPAAPTFGDERSVWAGVDVFDDGIFLAFLEIAGAPNDSVDIVFVVAVFADESLGKLPVDFQFGFVEGRQEFSIGSTANLVNRRVINAGPFCEVVVLIG